MEGQRTLPVLRKGAGIGLAAMRIGYADSAGIRIDGERIDGIDRSMDFRRATGLFNGAAARNGRIAPPTPGVYVTIRGQQAGQPASPRKEDFYDGNDD